ncbi:hypothetical protein PR002_g30222 [Phytophthora rubi]|uniref:Uncharacterized protein n=1 Tax=Phytophthora rubi TaxID=129364 RepID=A0A6A3GU08_9STRA|nr:hypothetical protein PR002_g30222 [Phytophthora rubi]
MNKAFYSHTAVFYEDKPGRILLKDGTEAPTVPTSEYLDIDATTLQNIPALLEEAQAEEIPESECRTDGASGGAVPTEVAGESRAQQMSGASRETTILRKRARASGISASRKRVRTDEKMTPGAEAAPVKDNAPRQMKRKRGKRKKPSCERYDTPNEESDGPGSGRCAAPAVEQDDKETKWQQSSARLPGAITTTSNEKLDADGDSPMGDLTVSEQ